MDLIRETQRLRLDLLAVQISQQLQAAEVPHALLKGPSTANWLYDPPRRYVDVDMLVPLSRVGDVVSTLRASGIAEARAGRVGEEAQHSLLMLSSAGFEVDVHVSLPTVPAAGDRAWDVLAAHVEALDLGVGTVPALDTPARCLVLALHALNRAAHPQAGEDLRRAHAVVDRTAWHQAHRLATRLDAADLFEAGVTMIGPVGPNQRMSKRAYLYASGAPSAALGWQRVVDARPGDRLGLLWREFVPTRGFMHGMYPELVERRLGLPRAHLRRWRGIAAQLPAAVRASRTARSRHRIADRG